MHATFQKKKKTFIQVFDIFLKKKEKKSTTKNMHATVHKKTFILVFYIFSQKKIGLSTKKYQKGLNEDISVKSK